MECHRCLIAALVLLFVLQTKADVQAPYRLPTKCEGIIEDGHGYFFINSISFITLLSIKYGWHNHE